MIESFITTEEIASKLGVEFRANRVPAFLATFGIRCSNTITVEGKTRQVYNRERVEKAIHLVNGFKGL